MKITGYQQSVGTGGTASNTIKTVGAALAYGTGGTGAAALSKAYGQVAAVIEQRNEQEDKESILNAMDVFNKSRYNIMYNNESGLMNTKLEGSAGITESYNEQINKARQDILGNTKLHSKKNQVALNHLMYNSAQEGFQTVDRYQQKQHEAVTDLRYGNNIQNYSEFVQQNWDDPQLLDNAIRGAALTTSMVYGNRGAEFVEAQQRKSVGTIVASAVDARITHGDYNGARKTLEQYGHYLDAGQRAIFQKAIYKKEEGAFENDLAKKLVTQYGDNEAAIKAALDKEYAYSAGGADVEPQAEGSTWVRNNDTVSLNGVKQQVTTGLSDIAKEFNAMSGAQLIVTSGTDSTDIHQAGAHSHGAGVKLDVAAGWLENADNRQKFIAYAESKGIKVLDEYAYPSANSTGGHLDLDFTDYKGGEGKQKRLLNYEEKERIWQACSREINANKRIKQYNETKLYNEIKGDIFSMLQNGTSYTDAFAWAEQQAGSDPDRYVSYVNAVKSIYGAGGNAGSGTSGGKKEKLGTMGKDALLDMLGAGAFSDKNKAYFLAYAREHGATNSEMDALDKGWDDWMEGAGQFAYNWSDLATSVMGKKNDQNMKNGLIKAGKEFVRTYRAQHNGMNPDESLIIEQMNKDIVNKVYGTYQVHRDWLPDLSVTVQGNNAQLAAAGIASVEKVGDDWYHVTYFDGTDGNINGGYLSELIGGGR